MVKAVSVIGVATIGAPVARRIRDAGFDLTVCDLNEDALTSFAHRGVKVAQTLATARLDLVLVVVAPAEQVQDVLTGARRVARGR